MSFHVIEGFKRIPADKAPDGVAGWGIQVPADTEAHPGDLCRVKTQTGKIVAKRLKAPIVNTKWGTIWTDEFADKDDLPADFYDDVGDGDDPFDGPGHPVDPSPLPAEPATPVAAPARPGKDAHDRIDKLNARFDGAARSVKDMLGRITALEASNAALTTALEDAKRRLSAIEATPVEEPETPAADDEASLPF